MPGWHLWEPPQEGGGWDRCDRGVLGGHPATKQYVHHEVSFALPVKASL